MKQYTHAQVRVLFHLSADPRPLSAVLDRFPRAARTLTSLRGLVSGVSPRVLTKRTTDDPLVSLTTRGHQVLRAIPDATIVAATTLPDLEPVVAS